MYRFRGDDNFVRFFRTAEDAQDRPQYQPETACKVAELWIYGDCQLRIRQEWAVYRWLMQDRWFFWRQRWLSDRAHGEYDEPQKPWAAKKIT